MAVDNYYVNDIPIKDLCTTYASCAFQTTSFKKDYGEGVYSALTGTPHYATDKWTIKVELPYHQEVNIYGMQQLNWVKRGSKPQFIYLTEFGYRPAEEIKINRTDNILTFIRKEDGEILNSYSPTDFKDGVIPSRLIVEMWGGGGGGGSSSLSASGQGGGGGGYICTVLNLDIPNITIITGQGGNGGNTGGGIDKVESGEGGGTTKISYNQSGMPGYETTLLAAYGGEGGSYTGTLETPAAGGHVYINPGTKDSLVYVLKHINGAYGGTKNFPAHGIYPTTIYATNKTTDKIGLNVLAYGNATGGETTGENGGGGGAAVGNKGGNQGAAFSDGEPGQGTGAGGGGGRYTFATIKKGGNGRPGLIKFYY